MKVSLEGLLGPERDRGAAVGSLRDHQTVSNLSEPTGTKTHYTGHILVNELRIIFEQKHLHIFPIVVKTSER